MVCCAGHRWALMPNPMTFMICVSLRSYSTYRLSHITYLIVHVTIPAVTPTFFSTSHPVASPEVPRDTNSGHVPLGSHMIHPRAPLSRPVPREPVSHPCWVRLRESPPSTPDAPDEPESSPDPQIDSAVLTEDLSILQGLLSELPMSLWSAVPDTDGYQCPTQ